MLATEFGKFEFSLTFCSARVEGEKCGKFKFPESYSEYRALFTSTARWLLF